MLRDIFDIFPLYPFMACPAQAARLASLKLRGGMLGFSSLPGGSGHLEHLGTSLPLCIDSCRTDGKKLCHT